MPVCEIDLSVGGKYRYVWRREASQGDSTCANDCGPTDMGLGGVYREIVPHQRLVSTEKFDHAWYPGEAIGILEFVERAGITTVTQTVRYESREARDGVLRSPMESGVAAGYDRLEELLETMS
jgi:uncharacterized protein YndB with AHSA1/START domain